MPRVTEIVRTVAPAWQCDEWYLQRGTACHLAIALMLKGQLDWASVDPIIEGRVRAVQRFVKDVDATPLFIESKITGSGYEGTPDLVALIGGFRCVVDWKGGAIQPAAQLQLAAYSLAVGNIDRVVAVETKDDASYKCIWGTRNPKRDHAHFNLTDAENIFKAVLTAYNWRQTHYTNNKEN